MGPWAERARMTRLGRGGVVREAGVGVCAVTMYCSLRMSWREETWVSGEEGEVRRGSGRGAYEDPDDGVMIGVVDVVGEAFDDLE